MIKNLLSLNRKKIKFDETDALAVSVCHSVKINSYIKSNNSWKSFIEKNPEKVLD
jgi:Holliday junction resolvasome RuvABC endonuclease subunit